MPPYWRPSYLLLAALAGAATADALESPLLDVPLELLVSDGAKFCRAVIRLVLEFVAVFVAAWAAAAESAEVPPSLVEGAGVC